MVDIQFFLDYRGCIVFFFFFQAEDGIRDYKVTGVQTCALPICDLDRGGKGGQGGAGVDADLQPAWGGAGRGVLGKGAGQPEVVQRRGAQFVDQAADVGDRRLGLFPQVLQQRAGRVRVGAHEPAGGVELHGDPGQDGAEAVVQVAADAASFFFPGGDQPLPGLLELCGQAGRVHGRAGVVGQAGQQPPVGVVEGFGGPAGGDDQVADVGSGGGQRDAQRYRAGWQGAVGGGGAGRPVSVGDLDGGVGAA